MLAEVLRLLGAARRRPLSRRHVRRRRLCRGDPGSRAPARCGRSIAIPMRSPAAPAWPRAFPAGCICIDGQFGDMLALLAGARRHRAGRRGAGSRRVLVPARRTRRAAFRSAPTGRSTCAWDRAGRRRPTWSTRCRSANWPTCCSNFGEERASRRIARAIVAARAEAPIDDHRAPGRDHPRRAAAGPLRHRSRDPQLPGAAHPGERRTGRDRARRWSRPAGCWRPAAGWSWWRSIRWRTASSSAS